MIKMHVPLCYEQFDNLVINSFTSIYKKLSFVLPMYLTTPLSKFSNDKQGLIKKINLGVDSKMKQAHKKAYRKEVQEHKTTVFS